MAGPAVGRWGLVRLRREGYLTFEATIYSRAKCAKWVR